VAIDKRGIATGGVICFIQLGSGAVTRVNTAHQPSQIVVSKGGLAYIPCPSDDLLTEWNVAENRLVRTLRLNPGGSKFLGVAPNALAFSPDESKLFLACGSYNAIGVVDLASGGLKELGYLSADWYPIGVAASSDHLWAINAKGIGSRGDATSRRSVYSFTGTISSFAWPVSDLASETQRAMRQATALKDEEAIAGSNPLHAGSPIEHVFYIIKENRTYDQVLGDMPQGDGDPKFLEFGRAITPNAHAISSQFALLDNFYCNGVNSADGHSWATEGNASSFFERSFGGFTRSYPFVVDDPLIPNPSGFLWNNALRHGKSFLNYGESDYAGTNKSFAQNLADLKAGKKTTFTQNIPVSDLKDHSLRDFPGWNLEIPDQVRAARFIEDFRQREAKGTVPSLSIIYLPEDHTGSSVSPSTCVADNDYATGLVIEAITHSKIWAKSAIFVVEDDAQAGVDHVDGHRSPCLVVSPYTPRGKTLSHFYSQVSVLHTIELILGLPPMNRFDQLAPPMVAAFDGPFDLTPYEAVKPKLALQKAPAFMRNLALNFRKPDQVDPSILNRLIWRATRPGEPYPVAYEGSNDGRLAARGLVRAKNRATKRDDD
jgi:DNA-binding beta-propeller fold protein YncE